MDIPAQLYHATNQDNVDNIMENGLVAYFPAVYMTDDLSAARYFAGSNGAIFVINTENLDSDLLGTFHEMLCDILHTSDFWHYYGSIPPSELSLYEEVS